MADPQPTTTELDERYSDPAARPTPWEDALAALRGAELAWCTTTRPGGGPHTTPLLAVVLDGVPHITTGPGEQKARNLAADARCSLLTGCNRIGDGLDVVVEATAVRVTDDATLHRLAEAWEATHGSDWQFDVRDGAFHHGPGEAHVFRLEPTVAYGFAKGTFGHTRWRFSS